jgi:hypothetical protein
MKVRTILGLAAAAILPTSAALADKYDELVTKGYRWVTTDGPFACRSKDDLHRLITNQSDENRLRMVSQGGVYYLIRGVIVQVVQEDKASGLSQVHWDGIAANLWTPSKFLSRHPITNILGTISVPGQPIGVSIPGVNSQLDVTVPPSPTATPTHNEASEPAANPTPLIETVTPSASPTP